LHSKLKIWRNDVAKPIVFEKIETAKFADNQVETNNASYYKRRIPRWQQCDELERLLRWNESFQGTYSGEGQQR